LPIIPKVYDRFCLTSPVPPDRVPEALATAAGAYWLQFRGISDYRFRIRRVITYKNMFAHAFKCVMTVTVSSNGAGSVLRVEIRPHILVLAWSCFLLLFPVVFLLYGLIERNVTPMLVGCGFILFGYLLLAIRVQIDSEIFTGFLEDVLTSHRQESPQDQKAHGLKK